MTAAQLKRALRDAGLSQRGAAKLLNINERTMRKYIAGEAAAPRTIEYALRWVISQRGKAYECSWPDCRCEEGCDADRANEKALGSE